MKKKSKAKKIILWVVLSFIALMLIGAGAIVIFFPKDKVKEMAIAQMSEKLNREVTIDNISVSFWGGIGAYLEHLTIANPPGFSEKYMVEAQALDIKLQFWPLLHKEVVVDRLILIEPDMNFRKLADGRVNYQFEVSDTTMPEEVAAKVEKMSDESKLAVSAVTFENLAIRRGKCLYADDSSHIELVADDIDLQTSVKTDSPTLFLADGDIEIGSLSFRSDTSSYPVMAARLNYQSQFSLSDNSLKINETVLRLNDIKFDVNGKVGNLMDMADAEFDIKSDKISFVDLVALLTEEQKAMLADYEVQTDVGIDAKLLYNVDNSDSLIYNGTIQLGDAKIKSGLFPDEVDLAPSTIRFDNNQVIIDGLSGEYLGNPFKLSVNIANFDNPRMKGTIGGALKLESAKVFLPNPNTFQMSGDMLYDFKFDYPMDKPEATVLTGSIDLKNGTYKAEALPENIEQMTASLKIKSRDIEIKKLDVQFESSDLALTGTMKNVFPYFIPGYEEKSARPFLDFKLTSDRFDVDKLFPEVAPGEGASFEDVPVDSIPPFILPDIDGSGTGNIGTLIYSQVEFTNIKSNIKIEDRKIKVTEANANVYTGKVTGETEIDLNDFENPVYSGTFNATQVEANDFLSRFTKFGGHLYGKTNLEGAFSASGLEPELILQSLNMDGKSTFKEGRLVNFDLVNNLAQQFNISAPAEEKIRDLVNSFSVKDGRLAFDAMKFVSNMGDWAVDGSVGFDGTLDYKCKVLLTKEYANQIVKKLGSDLVGSLLKNDVDQRIEVPFKLGGTYKKPTIMIEQKFWDDIQKKFMNQQKDKLENKVGDALKKLLGN